MVSGANPRPLHHCKCKCKCKCHPSLLTQGQDLLSLRRRLGRLILSPRFITWHIASGDPMHGLLVMGIPYQHAPEVSILRTCSCSCSPGQKTRAAKRNCERHPALCAVILFAESWRARTPGNALQGFGSGSAHKFVFIRGQPLDLGHAGSSCAPHFGDAIQSPSPGAGELVVQQDRQDGKDLLRWGLQSPKGSGGGQAHRRALVLQRLTKKFTRFRFRRRGDCQGLCRRSAHKRPLFFLLQHSFKQNHRSRLLSLHASQRHRGTSPKFGFFVVF